MKSIANKLKFLENEDPIKLNKEIIEMEENYYKLLNDNALLEETNDELNFNLNKYETDHAIQLSDMSKKITKTLHANGEEAALAELALARGTMLDHFALAYLADTGLKFGQIKMVQRHNPESGAIELYFDKHTDIIL